MSFDALRHRCLSPLFAASVAAGLMLGPALPSQAFCGFYVAGADSDLFANATMVVLMRHGKRTVLSMRNDYAGPPEDFAMVIPVPVVLGEDDVRTIDPALFDRVDKLAAPRLVEYWEQDPCAPQVDYASGMGLRGTGRGGGGPGFREKSGKLGVTVEAEFEVDEYDVVILSAKESTGLDTWLRDNNYNIPAGAQPLLEPYVESGMKFFVAKVDASKVTFDANGKATLSPLRFHYDTDSFDLPIRLGLINAPAVPGAPPNSGKQDLLVHILAPETRFDVANYPKTTIPTNLEVNDTVRDHFGEFYVSLFDHTQAQTPGAVVTEYAWSAGGCDPCPAQPLNGAELAELGADVLPLYAKRAKQALASEQPDDDLIGLGNRPGSGGFAGGFAAEFVLTRLHARYDASSLGEDLVFESAKPITGGRERPIPRGSNEPEPDMRDGAPLPSLERGATVMDPRTGAVLDNFQARYIMRHPWTGKIECEDPTRGVWGSKPEAGVGGDDKPMVARELAYAPRNANLGSFVTAGAAGQLGVSVLGPEPAGEVEPPKGEGKEQGAAGDAKDGADEPKSVAPKPEAGCSCSADPEPGEGRGLALLALLGLGGLGLGRRRV